MTLILFRGSPPCSLCPMGPQEFIHSFLHSLSSRLLPVYSQGGPRLYHRSLWTSQGFPFFCWADNCQGLIRIKVCWWTCIITQCDNILITVSPNKKQRRLLSTELAINPVGGTSNLWVTQREISSSQKRRRNETHGEMWSGQDKADSTGLEGRGLRVRALCHLLVAS